MTEGALSSVVRWKSLSTLAIVGLITVVYWPVRKAGLVWDDKVFLHDTAWLRDGNHWVQVALHGFSDWVNYFRPVGVALFALESGLFDLAPEPMHLLSLGLHLTNTLLVGRLARHIAGASAGGNASELLVPAAMLCFGLHPALIEPITWISSQCELVLTMAMLCGLLLNVMVHGRAARAVCVGLCFFVAACTKESAISFPILIIVVDWFRESTDDTDLRPVDTIRRQLRRQWLTYSGILVAGLAYLLLRYWGLGFLIQAGPQESLAAWSRFQTVCFTYVAYLKLLVWPMTGLGPIHLVAAQRFSELTQTGLLIDSIACTILVAGVYLFVKRKPLGGLLVGATVTLLPVVHIIPIGFDDSLYHDRYVMSAVAMMCAFIPLTFGRLSATGAIPRPRAIAGATVAGAWLLMAIINIRVTLPLWSDEAQLWQWALRQNPGSIIAQDNLLSTYLERNDLVRSGPLIDSLMSSPRECANCMLNVAHYAILRRDVPLATSALERAKPVLERTKVSPRIAAMYLVDLGNLNRLQHQWENAEQAYRKAITVDPLDPNAHMNLAVLLAQDGRKDEARTIAERAIALYPVAERSARKSQLEAILIGFDASAPIDQDLRRPE